jgi:hypothetical protein
MTALTQRERTRILIWGKTYPELSSKYTETVCTGGVREDGRPIRLYPVPLRYLQGEHQYQLYDLIDVSITKSTKDPRPESYKIDPTSLVRVGHVDTDVHQWAARQDWIARDRSWHIASMDEMHEAQRRDATSIGFLKPGEICEVKMRQKPASARKEHETKWDAVTAQHDLFPKEYKELEFIPVEYRLLWRCADRCAKCQSTPHDMMVLDWGLIELGRKTGDWTLARDRLAAIANLSTHDFRLFLGNFFLHQRTFGVIGLWYPPLRQQLDLTLGPTLSR